MTNLDEKDDVLEFTVEESMMMIKTMGKEREGKKERRKTKEERKEREEKGKKRKRNKFFPPF